MRTARRLEHAGLLRFVQAQPLKEMRYKEYTARRRGISFGGSYDFDTNRPKPGAPLPEALHPLRARVAAWACIEAEEITHLLIAEYQPGTPTRLAPRRARFRRHHRRLAVRRRGDAVQALRAGCPGLRGGRGAVPGRAAFRLQAEENVEFIVSEWSGPGRAFFAKHGNYPQSFEQMLREAEPNQVHARTALHLARIAVHLGDRERAQVLVDAGLARAPERATSLKADLAKVLDPAA